MNTVPQDSDAGRLTEMLTQAGATRQKIIAIIDRYGGDTDWDGFSMRGIIAECWESDLNIGEEYGGITDAICAEFAVDKTKAVR